MSGMYHFMFIFTFHAALCCLLTSLCFVDDCCSAPVVKYKPIFIIYLSK